MAEISQTDLRNFFRSLEFKSVGASEGIRKAEVLGNPAIAPLAKADSEERGSL
jgi:hypothetical protein